MLGRSHTRGAGTNGWRPKTNYAGLFGEGGRKGAQQHAASAARTHVRKQGHTRVTAPGSPACFSGNANALVHLPDERGARACGG